MSSSHKGMVDPATLCHPDDAELHHTQYIPLHDYEEYPSEFAPPNSSIYLTKSASRVGIQNAYRNDRKPSATMDDAHHDVAGGLGGIGIVGGGVGIGMHHEEAIVPTVGGYMQASQYDEISEYGITTASSCPMVDPNAFGDNPAVVYGYVSEANYRMQSDSVNTNCYATRPVLFDDNLNGAEARMAQLDPNAGARVYDGRHDFQKQMSQLTLNPLDAVLQLQHDGKNELMDDGGNEMRWRDPNLSEVISFLNNPNNTIKANAAAYLAHLCYMDDPNKQRTRTLGGIPPLVHLLSYDAPDIHKNACGALRNLSYGRQNDENKRAIKNAGGITALANLLCRTQESEVKELVTGVLWNMSSCEDIKRAIIDESLSVIVNNIIKPHSGWDSICPGETCFSTVFRNASGVLRNVSSAGEYARTSLRNAEHLVECLMYVLRHSIEKNNISNKTIENCVCILRNLSYRCQEVEDPNYDKQPTPVPTRNLSSISKGENLGCFGTSKKKKNYAHNEQQQSMENSSYARDTPKISMPNGSSGGGGGLISGSGGSGGTSRGYEQLWKPEVVQCYLALLQSCSNPETLEAAAGAIQNLSACFWQPSIDIRATVRKEKGLPILVELLRMEVDRVVCAVATALRNLAIDQRNKELIGKYAMRDLVQKLPSGNPQHDQSTSDDTITAVLATINEVIKKNPEFSRSLLDAGGVERLMNITRRRQKYTSCVIKFSSQVLFTMWQHSELRDVYKKHGWKEQDFVTKYFTANNAALNSPNNANNTLNRPMASQSCTRYEDRTIQRVQNNMKSNGDSGGGGGGGHQIVCNDSSMLCRMVDEVSISGVGDDTLHHQQQHQQQQQQLQQQHGAQNSQLTMYIPSTSSDRDHSE